MLLMQSLSGFLRVLYFKVAEMTWMTIGLALGLHMASSWLGFALAGEPVTKDLVDFVYYYATTGTTIGYGDISPETRAGKLIAVLWLFPGSIALFTTVIAKAIGSTSDLWKRNMNGLGDYSNLFGAAVIVGYHPVRTAHMIDEIEAGGLESDIVLVSKKITSNPDPRIRFVRAESLTEEKALLRAGVAKAARIVVYADDDEQTLAAALAVGAINRTGHIVVFFESADTARLLRSHCPRVECVVSTATEQVVRAMQDPGSSVVIDTLVSSTDSATIYSIVLPETCGGALIASISEWLRRNYQATLLAFTENGNPRPIFHYEDNWRMAGGSRIFIIRDTRLTQAEVDWSTLP